MPRRRVSVTFFWLRLVLPAAAVALGVTWWLNREPAPVSRERGGEVAMLADDGLHPSGAMYELWAEAALATAENAVGTR